MAPFLVNEQTAGCKQLHDWLVGLVMSLDTFVITGAENDIN